MSSSKYFETKNTKTKFKPVIYSTKSKLSERFNFNKPTYIFVINKGYIETHECKNVRKEERSNCNNCSSNSIIKNIKVNEEDEEMITESSNVKKLEHEFLKLTSNANKGPKKVKKDAKSGKGTNINKLERELLAFTKKTVTPESKTRISTPAEVINANKVDTSETKKRKCTDFAPRVRSVQMKKRPSPAKNVLERNEGNFQNKPEDISTCLSTARKPPRNPDEFSFEHKRETRIFHSREEKVFQNNFSYNKGRFLYKRSWSGEVKKFSYDAIPIHKPRYGYYGRPNLETFPFNYYSSTQSSLYKWKRSLPTKEELDEELDNYMAEIKFKPPEPVKNDIDSFVEEYMLEAEKCLQESNAMILE